MDKAIAKLWATNSKYPLAVLQKLGGYYRCPKSLSKRLGPLVGYAGRDANGRQFVGEIYADFAKLEEWPFMFRLYADTMKKHFFRSNDGVFPACFCGAPMGGLAFAAILASHLCARYVHAEKKITKLAADGQREESELIFGRHQPKEGERVAIVEDVTNNFSTTETLISLIQSHGARVVAIACLLNRSLTVDAVYSSPAAGCDLPVISLVRQPIQQWSQDDPAVADDIKAGNVVWKPENEWNRLMAAMNATAAE